MNRHESHTYCMRSRISNQLAKLMKDRLVSQSELSRSTGVPQPTINRILNEVTLEPRHDTIVRIANFFGVTPDSMYTPLPQKASDNPMITADLLYTQIVSLDDYQRQYLFSKVEHYHK
jgi:transcriptional regulator with XRE-family HTH domain